MDPKECTDYFVENVNERIYCNYGAPIRKMQHIIEYKNGVKCFGVEYFVCDYRDHCFRVCPLRALRY